LGFAPAAPRAPMTVKSREGARFLCPLSGRAAPLNHLMSCAMVSVPDAPEPFA
jgi:hypothetical protein